MSGGSSSAAGWSTRLEPARRLKPPLRPGEVRLNEVIEPWQGDAGALTCGRPVLIGFPHDEGVRRNGGRGGAALAPQEIRRWLCRLTAWDPQADIDLTLHAPLDLGDIRQANTMEEMQESLGEVIAEILRKGAVAVVLGGGHETAYGHYLGYVAAQRRPAIINLDAHLDLRPLVEGRGHSGSPFRQALEHPSQPLEGRHYVCLGAQPQATCREHVLYARQRGCVIRWRDAVAPDLAAHFTRELTQLATEGCQIYVSLDADVARAADVPGVSAPNPTGVDGDEVVRSARLAGQCTAVSSIDLVEMNPLFDSDNQSGRWAALVIWNFLVGVTSRPRTP
jgi:formiminoglutamase